MELHYSEICNFPLFLIIIINYFICTKQNYPAGKSQRKVHTRPPHYLVHSFDLVAFVRKRINYVSCSSKEKEILLASLFIFIHKHNHAQLNKPASRTLLVKRKRYYEISTYFGAKDALI